MSQSVHEIFEPVDEVRQRLVDVLEHGVAVAVEQAVGKVAPAVLRVACRRVQHGVDVLTESCQHRHSHPRGTRPFHLRKS